jgi:hypothetical protein
MFTCQIPPIRKTFSFLSSFVYNTVKETKIYAIAKIACYALAVGARVSALYIGKGLSSLKSRISKLSQSDVNFQVTAIQKPIQLEKSKDKNDKGAVCSELSAVAKDCPEICEPLIGFFKEKYPESNLDEFIKTNEHVKNFIKKLETIPSDRRLKVFNESLSILRQSPDKEWSPIVKIAALLMEENYLDGSFHCSFKKLSLQHEDEDSHDIYLGVIAGQLFSTPPSIREKVVAESIPVMKVFLSKQFALKKEFPDHENFETIYQDCGCIIKLVKLLIEEDCQKSVAAEFLELFDSDQLNGYWSTHYNLESLANSMKSCPIGKRLQIFVEAKPVMREAPSIWPTILLISKLLVEDKNRYSPGYFAELFKSSETNYPQSCYYNILHCLESINSDRRLKVLEEFRIIFQKSGKDAWCEIIPLVDFLLTLNKDQSIAPYFSELFTDSEIETVWPGHIWHELHENLKLICPKENCLKFFKELTPILRQYKITEWGGVIRIGALLPVGDNLPVKYAIIFKNRSPDLSRFLSKIPSQRRLKVIDESLEVLQGMQNNLDNFVFLLKIADLLLANDSSQSVCQILMQLEGNYSLEGLYKGLLTVFPERRLELIEQFFCITKNLSLGSKISLDSKIGVTLLTQMNCISPTDLQNLINYIDKQVLENFKWDLFHYVNACSMFMPEFQKALLSYMETMLQSGRRSFKEKVELACGIISFYTKYLLNQDDALYILATNIMNFEKLGAYKEAKSFHEEILRDVAGETLVVPVLAADNIQGVRVQWNLETLQKKAAWEGMIVNDLPKGITVDSIKDLFKSIEDRYGKMSNAEKFAFNKYIYDFFGTNLAQMKAKLLNGYILSLFEFENLESKISVSQFQLFSCLKYIIDVNNGAWKESDSVKTLNTGSHSSGVKEVLTHGEYVFLRFCEGIQMCNTGKDYSINAFYERLPDEYKNQDVLKFATGVKRLEENLDNCMQLFFNQMCENQKLLEELAHKKDVRQSVHYTLYLKNRFHKNLGIRHQVIFDEHTGVLNPEFVSQDPQDVVKTFFNYCTPLEAVKELRRCSPNFFKDNLYIEITTMMINVERTTKKGFIESDFYTHIEEYITLDEDLKPIKLTKKGALTLLKAADYFV